MDESRTKIIAVPTNLPDGYAHMTCNYNKDIVAGGLFFFFQRLSGF
jgi:hypothetical protein